ncbi:DUF4259 domain-containing protein [Streptosporangium sp. CA-115845]|uniref:DUF4259 domain-containing protein n=1 Tax=Streptosporangium sp. CA-115845 TaxID=3240071 RepID=UPI003D94D244
MGTWGAGPFDSDTALDLLDAVSGLPQSERLESIVGTLNSGMSEGPSAISSVTPEEVIAAASIVAANLPSGESFPWNGEVSGISEWLPKPVPAAVVETALRALDAALPSDGWWWESWIDASEKAQIQDSLEQIRSVLRGLN